MANKSTSTAASSKTNIQKIIVEGTVIGSDKDFTLEINLDDIGDDFELSEAVAKYNLGEWGYTFIVLEHLVGEEAYKRIKDECRLDNGRVSSEKVDKLCTEIMNQLNLKN